MIGFAERYLEDQELAHQSTLERYTDIVDSLQDVPVAAAAEINQHIMTYCRECMFHTDACFMNIIYLVFKSIEKRSYIAPKKLRPPLRIRDNIDRK